MTETITEDSRKKFRATAIVILCLSACFMFFLYAPLELYFLNKSEFFYDIYILLPPLLFNFALFFAVSLLFFWLFRQKEKIQNIFICIYFICFICAYIQGNYLAAWLPMIKGQMLNWNDYPIHRIESILLWGLGSAIVIWMQRRFRKYFNKIVCYVSGFVGLMLLLTLIFLCINTEGYQKKKILSTATAKNILTVSEEENFIVLLMDATDASVMNEVLEETPAYKDVFQDFTYYTNAMGGYPYTHHSIVLILTGQLFQKQMDFESFAENAYRESPLFEQLANRDFKIGIYEPDFYIDSDNNSNFDNILDCERRISSYFTFCRWQIQMTGYRYAPFDLKRFCYVYTNAFNTLKALPDNQELYQYDNWFFWNKLNREEMTVVEDKCFRFIHLEGAHSPSLYDAEMNRTDVSNYKESLKATIKISEVYLDKLKERGVYDNSTIIIMADHGGDYGFHDNPIFFVKGKGERHPLQMNDAPISYMDLQEAYSRLLDGKAGNELFDYREGDERERYFYFQDDDDNPLEIMEEYIQKGHAGNRDTLIKIREF